MECEDAARLRGLASFFETEVGVGDASLSRRLASMAWLESVSGRGAFLREGDPVTSVGFLRSGLMRSYLLDASGSEVTDCFVVAPGTPVLPSAELGGASPTTFEALEDSELVCLDAAQVRELVFQSTAASRAYCDLLRWAWREHWEVKQAICRGHATERVRWFTEKFPGLIERVPNRHIASYLGMSAVTLSRARSALRRAGEAPRYSSG